ncbi:MAG: hypothetical protein EOO38_28930 [Cytophagaceae bacterium]|nr:MAG: hypothetical protein EOO38_28930 [Cytophagaceae bacterium]
MAPTKTPWFAALAHLAVAESHIADSGLAAYEIQYTSADSNGNPVRVIGFVAIPAIPPHRSTGADLVAAYFHGTLRMYRGCRVFGDMFSNEWVSVGHSQGGSSV